ncbi:hypothetical protein BUALT_BualtUnG0050800 [Buddleja alternifolia]|uniref:Ty3 transposon capsid-like protein domain-containing protein n=1 Tax=Buddleja alternifolia TaxID=168488 RepID=A0AAV6W076_9LAMI|nr:hypothetical protein BUALT_BualtUnG0050800 [Buddleja alternifolia]
MSIQATMQASMEANQRMIQQQIQSVVDQMQVYNRNKSVLGEGLSATAERGSTSQPRRMSTPDLEGSLSQISYTPFPKVEFPHYDGEDTRTWIKKCNRYFQIVTTITEEQKVPLASIHLEGKAELWFQSFMEGGDLPSWDQFITALLKRFDDQDPELIVGQFNKLHQTGTVLEYLDCFEELKSHMLIFNKDLLEEFLSVSFVSGLREDIRGVVMSMRPHSFHQSISLAKKQESTVEAILKRAHQTHRINQAPKTLFKPPTYNSNPANRNLLPQPKPPYKPPEDSVQTHR